MDRAVIARCSEKWEPKEPSGFDVSPRLSHYQRDALLVLLKEFDDAFATDPKKPNMTKKDSYVMPDPHSILDKLQGSRVFSFMDAASAYWCVRVKKEDIEKTAFSIPRGHYEMNVMPFGLCNSQSTFQRILDTALATATNTESYVDDYLTHSRDFEELLSDLRKVLDCLREARIHLMKDKCRFGYQEGEFLGTSYRLRTASQVLV